MLETRKWVLNWRSSHSAENTAGKRGIGGLGRGSRYPLFGARAFEITRIFRARRGGESVPGGATGGGKEVRPGTFSSLSTQTGKRIVRVGIGAPAAERSSSGPSGVEVPLPGHAAEQFKVWSSGDNAERPASLTAGRGKGRHGRLKNVKTRLRARHSEAAKEADRSLPPKGGVGRTAGAVFAGGDTRNVPPGYRVQPPHDASPSRSTG